MKIDNIELLFYKRGEYLMTFPFQLAEIRKPCLVNGEPGTGIDRGTCPELMICLATGECRLGKLKIVNSTEPNVQKI